MQATIRLRLLAAILFSLSLAPATLAQTSDAAGPLADTPQIIEGPYLVADAETGEVLQHFDAVRPWYPASTTKLMTLYVAFRAVLAGEIALDSYISYSDTAAAQPPSKMAFKPGSSLTLDDALKIIMVKSANDVAMAVAEGIGGTQEGFAARMNQEAERLGMTRSHFVNPHGLPDERQVTTARDMAVLARALLVEFPQHRDYYKIHAIEFGGTVLKNYNTLIERYPGANGMKTGFICSSGYNLVASARRGGREFIAVVFGAYAGKPRAEKAAELLEFGFEGSGPASGLHESLQNVSSGIGYTMPFDMRPYICGDKRPETVSESPDGDAQTAEGAADAEPEPLLGPAIYLGPPIKVSVLPPQPEPFVARLPRPRPSLPSDAPQASVAFAPEEQSQADAPSAEAIGAAAGDATPLLNLYTQ